ncbi:DNA-processing protein DprA [Cellulosimicrobium cellulans]
METTTRLLAALTAFVSIRTPVQIERQLQSEGPGILERLFNELPNQTRQELEQRASAMAAMGIDVVTFQDPDYPEQLIQRGRPVAPILFLRGNRQLLHERSIGMCGSRHASELGLKAAQACGEEAADGGVTVVSGYAAGVDTVTHLASLSRLGSTVIVLAEGMDQFRVKRNFEGHLDPSRTLVVSQFAPWQKWAAHAAMTRNKIIYGLGQALVVIEAGERGGTLAAGEGALRIGRTVFVLNFGEETPPGNELLLAQGGIPIRSRGEFGEFLQVLSPVEQPSQGSLEI